MKMKMKNHYENHYERCQVDHVLDLIARKLRGTPLTKKFNKLMIDALRDCMYKENIIDDDWPDFEDEVLSELDPFNIFFT